MKKYMKYLLLLVLILFLILCGSSLIKYIKCYGSKYYNYDFKDINGLDILMG